MAGTGTETSRQHESSDHRVAIYSVVRREASREVARRPTSIEQRPEDSRGNLRYDLQATTITISDCAIARGLRDLLRTETATYAGRQ
jgi:hypothetical protein